VKTSIIDLTLNETVVCTIGEGASNKASGNSFKAGDGVIIVQYLGE